MRKLLFVFLCAILSFSSCQHTAGEDERKSAHKTVIIRYDKVLNDYVSYNSFSALQRLSGDYRKQTRILVENVLRIGSFKDGNYHLKLQTVYSDSILRHLCDDVLHKYDKLQEQEKKFDAIFARMKKDIPEVRLPVLYTQISALNQSVVVEDSLVGISLDKYMGTDYPLYDRFFHDYQRESMKPERIFPDVMKYYLMSVYPFPGQEPMTLINQMIYLGKVYYVTLKLLDLSSVGEMLNYTSDCVKWCEVNQAVIWKYMREHNHLDSDEKVLLAKYLDQVPFNEFFGEESPSKLGLWMGMQIVASYMDTHPDVSYHTLLSGTDYTNFLTEARFNP